MQSRMNPFGYVNAYNNAAMQYQNNPCARCYSAMCALLFGSALFIASFPLTYWHEAHELASAVSVDAAQASLVYVDAGAEPRPEDVGKLVYVAGDMDLGPAADPEFGVALRAGLLDRKVEMWQTVEHVQDSKTTNRVRQRASGLPSFVVRGCV